MKKGVTSLAFYLTILTLLCSFTAFSQLVNNGGTITIETDALLTCTGNVQNNSGTLTNNGRLEVQGNFFNAGTYNTTTADDSLIMTGPGNATINPGAALLRYLWINKTTAADEVKLAASTTVTTKLIYDQGHFTTDPIVNPTYVFSAPITAVFSFATGKEITGKVKRTGWLNGQNVDFNQPNMLVRTNGGSAPVDLTVSMIPQTSGGDPTLAEREVKRKFQFALTGGTGFTVDIRYPYADAELTTNIEANLVPWHLVSSEWNGRLSPVTRDATANFVSITGLAPSDLSYEWKLADPKYTFNLTAQLRGNSNGTVMTTGLNTTGVLNSFALSQPYNTAPFNYTGTESVPTGFFATHPDIVDWVLIEFRKPLTGLPADALSSTINGRKAGFLLSNGTITELDGLSPIKADITKQGTGFIVVRHRNHLGVMSNPIPTPASGTMTNNFTLLPNAYKAPGAPSDPVVLLANGINYGLWAGDVNSDGVVNITDVNAVKTAIAGSATGYGLTDATLSGMINGTDVSLVKNIIAASGTGSSPARTIIVRTNIPD
jgi:hypothetical protein